MNEDGEVILLIHSGSRNLGLQVANHYQDVAWNLTQVRRKFIEKNRDDRISQLKESGDVAEIPNALLFAKAAIAELPDRDSSWLFGKPLDDYLHDIDIVQKWASLNHDVMARSIAEALGWDVSLKVRSRHNYIDTTNNIIRKGAISARYGELGIIPLNMRDGVVIVRGKGAASWLDSAPHGAGRLYSRSWAKKNLSMDEFRSSMDGIYTSCVTESTLDESAMAYKPADEVIEAISPTVDIVDWYRPIYNYKAV